MGSGWFDAFREDSMPTRYSSSKTAAHYYLLQGIFIYLTGVLLVAYLLIIPEIRGCQKKLAGLLSWCISLYVAAIILICNYGMEWKSSQIFTNTDYKAFTNQEIEAEVGLMIGLRGINITLKGVPVIQLNETIDYNEQFSWTRDSSWAQGREGYGSYANFLNQEYREAQYRGIPQPILKTAEYFTIDGEDLRWGRAYRTAGFYGHIIMWAAFIVWLLANLLVFVIIKVAAAGMLTTGVCLLLVNLIHYVSTQGQSFAIHFEDDTILLSYGWCFWVNLGTGIFCIFLGTAMFFVEAFNPGKLSDFFLNQELQGYEDLDNSMPEKITQPLHNGQGSISPYGGIDNKAMDINETDILPIQIITSEKSDLNGIVERNKEASPPAIEISSEMANNLSSTN